MSFHRAITGGVPVSSDPDRALIEAYLAEHPVTVCPPRSPRPVAKAARTAVAFEPVPAVLSTETPRTRATDRSQQPSLRPMSIQQALEWAFITEKSRLDFDEYGSHEFDREGIDPIWRGMKMAELGTAVDGGGTSYPHIDAQIIAAEVEALPIEQGGRQMALKIAELARARRAPDWRVKLRVEQDGDQVVKSMDQVGIWRFRTERRQARAVRGEYCPIFYSGTATMLAKRRREYLQWYGAMLYLWGGLCGALHTIEITDVLPPLSPWKGKGGDP